MEHLIIDCETGEAETSSVTKAEASELAAATAAAEQAEQEQAAAAANETTIRGQAGAALAANRAFLAISSPTNAQTLTQVKALTKQNNALIRLLLHKLDGTD